MIVVLNATGRELYLARSIGDVVYMDDQGELRAPSECPVAGVSCYLIPASHFEVVCSVRFKGDVTASIEHRSVPDRSEAALSRAIELLRGQEGLTSRLLLDRAMCEALRAEVYAPQIKLVWPVVDPGARGLPEARRWVSRLAL